MAATKFLRVDEDVYSFIVSHMQGIDSVSAALRRLLGLPPVEDEKEAVS